MIRRLVSSLYASFAFKLAAFILLGTGAVLFGTLWYCAESAEGIIRQGTRETGSYLGRDLAGQIGMVLQDVERFPRFVARRLEWDRPDTKQVERLVTDILRTHPHIYGMTLAFEPGAPGENGVGRAPYFHRDPQGALRFVDLARSYDYRAKDWYATPKNLERPVWSEPYYDEGGGETLMCTFSIPFYREDQGRRVFSGIVTADIQLEHFTRVVSSCSILKGGHAFLLSQSGRIICHPNHDYIQKETIFSIADRTGNASLRELGRRMLRGDEGFAPYFSPHTRQISWACFAPVQNNGWSVGVSYPEEEVFADIHALRLKAGAASAISLLLLLGVTAWLSLRVTRPLRLLARHTTEIARGNLDTQFPVVPSRDEIGDLSRSFETMRRELKEYIANLASTTAARERMESELKIARQIQMSFLPHRFPPRSAERPVELYAHLEPAMDVGGDCHDFFMTDAQHLFITVGDVSGKGVPAALFMAVSKTLIKGIAELGLPPSKVLERVNAELAIENEICMFVTVISATLDLRTGRLAYANAGHPSALMARRGEPVAPLELPRAGLMGIEPGFTCPPVDLHLRDGDLVVFYSDGVTEAMNPQRKQFGEERLRQMIEIHREAAPAQLVDEIFRAVREFTAGASQSDDITVLAFRYLPEPGRG
jgi:sigma-B regulation protein RsbU (phosphoserine phosphatase)